MTDFEKTKRFFDDLGIPVTQGTREGYGEHTGLLHTLTIGHCDEEGRKTPHPLLGGYGGCEVTFMFLEDGVLFKMAVWR